MGVHFGRRQTNGESTPRRRGVRGVIAPVMMGRKPGRGRQQPSFGEPAHDEPDEPAPHSSRSGSAPTGMATQCFRRHSRRLGTRRTTSSSTNGMVFLQPRLAPAARLPGPQHHVERDQQAASDVVANRFWVSVFFLGGGTDPAVHRPSLALSLFCFGFPGAPSSSNTTSKDHNAVVFAPSPIKPPPARGAWPAAP